jgi:ribosomal protein S18
MARKTDCKFLNAKMKPNYKAPWMLKNFLDSEYGLKNRFTTRTSNKMQRILSKEVKKARIMGLLPFTYNHSQVNDS